MPDPNDYKTEQEFISACVKIVMAEGKTQDKALGQCYGMWRNRKKGVVVTENDTKTENKKGYFSYKTIVTKADTYIIENEEQGNGKFIKVPISGIKKDRQGDQMSYKALNIMKSYLKSGKIPFFSQHGKAGDVRYSWKDIMGKFVDGEQNGDNLYGIIKINEANADAMLLWKYIQGGMPVGFSIGGKVKKSLTGVHEYEEETGS